MRHVVKSGEVYHLWAAQAQDSARSSSAMSFEGTKAYSYRAVIGEILSAPNGERAYILDSSSFSVTTSSHQSDLYRAVYNRANVFRTEISLPHYGSVEPQAVLDALVSELPPLALKWKRARQYKDMYETGINRTMRAAADFAALFRLPLPAFDAVSDMAASIEKQDKEERARLREIEKCRQEQYAEYERQRIEEAQEYLPKWLAGDTDGYNGYWRLHRLPTAYLRLLSDGVNVQTTLGAIVPLDHIVKAAPLVLAYLREGREYKRNGHTIHLGHYVLDSIDRDGTVKAGCHTFAKEEILRFAALLGLI